MAFIYKNNPLKDGTYIVTSGYGQRSSGFHEAIDLGTYGGAAEPIYSVADGVVSYVGTDPNKGYGYYVDIDHGDGVITRYAHMRDVSLYTTGSEIPAGTVIGYVGSTGNSTGPHLHFEILRDGTKVDPTSYINTGGTSIFESHSGSNTINTAAGWYTYDQGSSPSGPVTINTAAGSYTYEPGGSVTVAAERVSDVTPQPVLSYVKIMLGEGLRPLAEYLSTPDPNRPNTLQMFEYNRLSDAGETASFTLFDDNWEEVELALAENFEHIYIEYGYWGSNIKSKRIKHRLLEYAITFEMTGVVLSISSVTEGSYENLKMLDLTLDTYNPTEAAKKICEEIGLPINDDYFDESEDIDGDNPFNLVKDYPLTYIRTVLVPVAAKEDEEIFTFYIDSEGYPHFERTGYDPKSSDMKTYVWQKGYDSPVIDLVFDIQGVFGGAGFYKVESEAKSAFHETDTKAEQYFEYNKGSVVTYATGDSTHTKSDQSDYLVDSAGYPPVQASNRLHYRLKHKSTDAYKATMTIVGDPTLQIDELIRIINVTDSGHLHHTSGVYRIAGITDTVQDGSMTTALELTKNAMGDVETIELLNPKYIVK